MGNAQVYGLRRSAAQEYADILGKPRAFRRQTRARLKTFCEKRPGWRKEPPFEPKMRAR